MAKANAESFPSHDLQPGGKGGFSEDLKMACVCRRDMRVLNDDGNRQLDHPALLMLVENWNGHRTKTQGRGEGTTLNTYVAF